MFMIKSSSIALLVAIAFIIIPYVSSTFFFLNEGKASCFLEDLNGESQVLVIYKCPMMDPNYREELAKHSDGLSHTHDLGIKIWVNDPFGKQIEHSTFHDKEGALHFVTGKTTSGLYEICVQTTTSHWFGKGQKIEFHMDVEIDYEHGHDKVESKERVDKITDLIQTLSSKMDYISSDQRYFKMREQRFAETTEDTMTRLYIFGSIQLLILIGTAVWQMFSWKTFLKKKKLI